MTITLRPYQREAVNAVVRRFHAGDRSTLLVMATGGGKTQCFADLARRARAKGRVLVIAHREELLTQAVDKITHATGLVCAVERGESRVDLAEKHDVVVASVQTLARQNRRERFAPDAFVLVIVDEAHHVTAEGTYRDVLDYFSSAKVLGVTATPDRLDKRALGAVFESVAFVYEIRDAIEQGWLVPIRQRRVVVDGLDLDTVRTKRGGDFDDEALAKQMLAETSLQSIAAPLVDLAGDRPTIAFTPTVAVATALAVVLKRYAGENRVAAISGETEPEDRKRIVGAYARGALQYLVNCMLLTEGFDAPRTSCIAVARPTKSRALYSQLVGRGTRLHPESGKADLLVVDFTGNSSRHRLITTADVLDGNNDEPVRARCAALLEADPDLPVGDALALASAQVAAETRAHLLVTARFHAHDIDPFAVLGADPRAGRHGGQPVTPEHATQLRKLGIDRVNIDDGQAAALIECAMDRMRAGLCTFKMARQLARFGLNPDVSFADAHRALTAIEAAGWKCPGALYSDPVLNPALAGKALA